MSRDTPAIAAAAAPANNTLLDALAAQTTDTIPQTPRTLVLALLVGQNAAEHDDQPHVHVQRDVDVVLLARDALRTIDLRHRLASALASSVEPDVGVAPTPVADEADLSPHAAQGVIEHDAGARSLARIVRRRDLEDGLAFVLMSSVHVVDRLGRERLALVVHDRRLVRVEQRLHAQQQLALDLEASGAGLHANERVAGLNEMRLLLDLGKEPGVW